MERFYFPTVLLSLFVLLSSFRVAEGWTVSFRKDVLTNTNESEIFIVTFFAPWCNHCKRFIPILRRVYDSIPNDLPGGRTFKFSEVDCNRHHEICLRQNVYSYPTVIAFSGGKILKRYHRAPRDINNLSIFIAKLSLLGVVYNYDDLEDRKNFFSLFSSSVWEPLLEANKYSRILVAHSQTESEILKVASNWVPTISSSNPSETVRQIFEFLNIQSDALSLELSQFENNNKNKNREENKTMPYLIDSSPFISPVDLFGIGDKSNFEDFISKSAHKSVIHRPSWSQYFRLRDDDGRRLVMLSVGSFDRQKEIIKRFENVIERNRDNFFAVVVDSNGLFQSSLLKNGMTNSHSLFLIIFDVGSSSSLIWNDQLKLGGEKLSYRSLSLNKNKNKNSEIISENNNNYENEVMYTAEELNNFEILFEKGLFDVLSGSLKGVPLETRPKRGPTLTEAARIVFKFIKKMFKNIYYRSISKFIPKTFSPLTITVASLLTVCCSVVLIDSSWLYFLFSSKKVRVRKVQRPLGTIIDENSKSKNESDLVEKKDSDRDGESPNSPTVRFKEDDKSK